MDWIVDKLKLATRGKLDLDRLLDELRHPRCTVCGTTDQAVRAQLAMAVNRLLEELGWQTQAVLALIQERERRRKAERAATVSEFAAW